MAAKIVLVRIDDRLIHGQVAIGWVKAVAAEHIVVADDSTADNPMMKILQEMAAPVPLKVTVCHVREVAAVCDSPALNGQRTLVLFPSPEAAVTGMESGLPMKEIDVGNLRCIPGREPINNAVAINEQDRANFRSLIGRGVRVVVQMVPTDEPVDMGKFLN